MKSEVEEQLYEAISGGDLIAIRRLLSEEPACDRQFYRDFLPWLSIAATEENSDVLRLLIGLGCDVNATRKEALPPETPLTKALWFDKPDNVRILLEHGASVEDTGDRRYIISAITGGKRHSLEMVKLLEQYGADLHQVFKNELTGDPMNALGEAVDWGKEDVAEYLRSKGCVMPLDTLPIPKTAQTLDEEIIAYFEQHFGSVSPHAIIEIVPTEPRIVVHAIPSSDERKYVTLFTTGMSQNPLNVDESDSDYRYAELFIQLPPHWQYTDLHNPDSNWPISWLRRMAQFPQQNEDWVSSGVNVLANGDPPRPLGRNVPFTAILWMAEQSFETQNGQVIQLYRLTPLYTEEYDLVLREDFAALMRAFDRNNMGFVVDMQRPNVANS